MILNRSFPRIGAIILLFITLLVNHTPELGADVRFRKFSEDASRLERHIESVKDSSTPEEWESAVGRAREILRAEWERDANYVVDAELKKSEAAGEPAGDLEARRLDAAAEWEKESEKAVAEAKGSWYARRQNILYGSFDSASLKDAIGRAGEAAGSVSSSLKLGTWDGVVDPEAAGVTASWEESLGSLMESMRLNAAEVEEASREAYEKEILSIEKELREAFRLERNTLVYKARNRLIWDTLFDHASLRYLSELGSASAVTDRVLAETKAELSKEEAEILKRDTTVQGETPSADISAMGENWQEEIRKLVESGLSKWNTARETLLSEMVKWKGASENAYIDGDRQWMDAMDRLSKARDEWRKDITGEIQRGLEEWRKKDGELAKNIEQSRKDLLAYLEAVKGQWESHSTALTEITLTGAGAYAQAMENISWLDGMIGRYGATGIFSGSEQWSRDVYGLSLYYNPDSVETFNGFAFTTGGDGIIARALKERGAMISSIDNRTTQIAVTSTLTGMRYDAMRDLAVETYTVSFTLTKSSGGLFGGGNKTQTITDVWEVENNTSPFCFYSREKERWQSMVGDLLSLVGESEDYIHNRNMLGEKGGPGFLRNALGQYGLNPEGSESDPYLLTEAELEYELALREKSYWEKRLSIAEAVMMYASPEDYGDDNPYAPGGLREGAADTEKRKDEALADMTAAKAVYETSLGEIATITRAMAVIKGDRDASGDEEYEQSIEYLSSLMEEKRMAMEEAREEYASYREAVIVLENGQGFDFLKTGLAEAQKSLGDLDAKLWELRKDYNFLALEGDRVDRLQSFSGLLSSALYERMEAERKYELFSEIMSGVPLDDDTLTVRTGELLLGEKADETWEGLDERRDFITAHYLAWLSAGDDEKEGARDALLSELVDEYALREAEWKGKDAVLSLVMDEEFSARNFLDSATELRKSIEEAGLFRRSKMNLGAFEMIIDAMEDQEGEVLGYDEVLERLRAEGDYSFGGNNDAWIVRNAAYHWVKENLSGLTAENSGEYLPALERERDLAGKILAMYADPEKFKDILPQTLAAADGGDEAARTLLREYYRGGSSMALFGELSRFDFSPKTALAAFDAKTEFVFAGGSNLRDTERTLTETDFTAELEDFARARDIDLRLSLDSDAVGLADAAAVMADWLKEKRERGEAVPIALSNLIDGIENAAMELTSLLSVYFDDGSTDAAEALALSGEEWERWSAAFEAISDMSEAFVGEDGVPVESHTAIENALRFLDNLDVTTRDYIALEYASGPVAEALSALSALENLAGTERESRLSMEYLSLGGALTPDEYVAALGDYLGAEEGARLAGQLSLLDMKIRFYGEMPPDSLSDWVDLRALESGLEADDASELRTFVIIDSFREIIAAGVPAYGDLPSEFRDYSRMHHFEHFLVSKEEGGDSFSLADEFISLAGAYADPAKRDGYAAFADAFRAGTADAYAYLPPDAAEYLVLMDYYGEYVSQGTALRGDEEMELFLARYADESMRDAVRGTLAEYIEATGAIDRYYGQDFGGYVSGLSHDAGMLFSRYYALARAGYGTQGALPFHELGIYGITEGLSALSAAADAALDARREGLMRALGRAQEALYDDGFTVTRRLRESELLAEYREDPASFESYRNYLLSDADFTGNLTESNAPRAASASPLSGTRDERDEEGNLTGIYFASAEASGGMLGSMILEASNELTMLMEEALLVGAGEDMTPGGETSTIAGFLARLTDFFDPGASYAYDPDGGYAFDGALTDLIAEVESLFALRGTRALEGPAGEMAMYARMLDERKAEVLGRGRSYFEMTAKSLTDLASARPAMQEMGKKCTAAEEDFNAAAKALEKAQARYETKHAEYIEKMRETSANHRAFTEAEYEYERAYAVWEYAFTPYLSDTTEKEAKAGYGEVEGIDGVLHEDLSMLPVPDAKENYERILGLFDTANEKYLKAKTKMDAQETVESLNADGEYSRLKGRFEAVAKSFTRLARAKELSDADTRELTLEVAAAKDAYKQAKNAANGFNKNSPMSPEDIEARDVILARMARFVQEKGGGRAGVDAYIDGILREYAAIPSEIREDMAKVREKGFNYDEFIALMCADYWAYREWERKWNEAKGPANSNNPARRKRWQRKRDHRKGKCLEHLQAYNHRYAALANYLNNVIETRNRFDGLTRELASLDQARDLEYLVSGESLGRSFYGLEETDLSRLYDNTSKEVPAAGEGVNITLLREKMARTDLDGFAVRVKKEQFKYVVDDVEKTEWRYYVLNSDESKSAEYFLHEDTSFLLSAEAGDSDYLDKDAMADGTIAYLTDYVYSASKAAEALVFKVEGLRQDSLNAYRTYGDDSITSKTHDSTVLLRDMEALNWGLMTYAAGIGKSRITEETVYVLKNGVPTKTTAKRETGDIHKSRQYRGYTLAHDELVSGEMSVGDRIVNAMLSQNLKLQEQLWADQKAKLTERSRRWSEETAYIKSRGEREWALEISGMMNLWRLWRADTRKKITEGEEDWAKALAGFDAGMESWKDAASKSSTKEAARRMYADLDADISTRLASINATLPKGVEVRLDTEKILSEAMKKISAGGIGVLSDSMKMVDTSAGFSSIVDLGLSGELSRKFSKQMDDFENAMLVTQNLRMAEAVHAILDNFALQLQDANSSNYDAVMTGLAFNFKAPFMRQERSKRQWTIKVVRSHSLVETKYRTIPFRDYADYVNTTVKTKSWRTLTGGNLDFSRPETYSNIDGKDLEAFVRLETDHLSTEIKKVFSEEVPVTPRDENDASSVSGSFGLWSRTEFNRLQEDFGNAYTEYLKGEAMLEGGWYTVPIAPGVPLNAMTLAKVGGSIALTAAGCPWAAFALNSAFTALEAKDGGLTWKQAAVQVGINAAITYASMGAGDLAGTAFDSSKSFGAQLAVAGARSTVTTFGGVVSSSVQYNPDGSMGWNQDHFSDSRTWSQAGLSFATSFAASAATIGMREGLKLNSNLLSTGMSSTINTMGANVKVGEGGGWNWQGFDNIDGQKAVITGAANYVSSTATGGMQDRYMQSMVSGMINAYALKGFSELFENYAGRDFGDEYSLNRAISVDTLSISAEGAYMDTKRRLTVAIMSDEKKAKLSNEEKMKYGMITDDRSILRKMGDGLLDAVTSIGTIGTSIANEVRTIGEDISNLGQRAGNLFSYGLFATDDNKSVIRAKQIEESKRLWDSGEMGKSIFEKYIGNDLNKLISLGIVGIGGPGDDKVEGIQNNIDSVGKSCNSCASSCVDILGVISMFSRIITGEKIDVDNTIYPVTRLDNGAILPIADDQKFKITSDFRSDKRKDHDGVDIGVPENTPVLSPMDGIVYDVGDQGRKHLGKYIVIKHNDNLFSITGHHKDLLVGVGDSVIKGQVVAKSGSTGDSSGPHIHYEIYTGDPGDMKKGPKPRAGKHNPVIFRWPK